MNIVGKIILHLFIVKKKEVYEIFLNLDSGKSIELNDGDYVKFKDIKGLE